MRVATYDEVQYVTLTPTKETQTSLPSMCNDHSTHRLLTLVAQ